MLILNIKIHFVPNHPDPFLVQFQANWSLGHQNTNFINSEGFLAEVFHPWVRWEGPGSGFESSSVGGASGIWKSGIFQSPFFVFVGIWKMGPRHICILPKPCFFFLREFETWDKDSFPKSEIYKMSWSFHSEWAHIKIHGLETCRVERCGTLLDFFMGQMLRFGQNGPLPAIDPLK